MFWFVLYVMVSIIMSVFYTLTIYKVTDLGDMSLTSRICFVVYFIAANLFAWPFYTIYTASMILNDDANII